MKTTIVRFLVFLWNVLRRFGRFVSENLSPSSQRDFSHLQSHLQTIQVPSQNGLVGSLKHNSALLRHHVPTNFGETLRTEHFALEAHPDAPELVGCVLYPVQDIPEASRNSFDSIRSFGLARGLKPIPMFTALSLAYCHQEELGKQRVIFMVEPIQVFGNGKDVFLATVRWDGNDVDKDGVYPMPVQAGESDMFGYPCEVGRFDLFPSAELLEHIPAGKRGSCLLPQLKVVPVTFDCSRDSFVVFMMTV